MTGEPEYGGDPSMAGLLAEIDRRESGLRVMIEAGNAPSATLGEAHAVLARLYETRALAERVWELERRRNALARTLGDRAEMRKMAMEDPAMEQEVLGHLIASHVTLELARRELGRIDADGYFTGDILRLPKDPNGLPKQKPIPMRD